MTIAIGGLRFPLTAGSLDLLPQTDPFLATFLPYWAALINHYCGAAYAYAMAGQALGPAGHKACAETTPLDPLMWLGKPTFRFPILGCYAIRGTLATKHTTRWEKTQTEYTICYALPTLDVSQAARVMPILQAVNALVVQITERQGDENYDGGTNPLAVAGVMSMQFGQTRYGLIKDEDKPTGFPCFELSVLVTLREDIVPGEGVPLQGLDPTMDIGAGNGTPAEVLLSDAIRAKVNFAPLTIATSAGTVATAATLS